MRSDSNETGNDRYYQAGRRRRGWYRSYRVADSSNGNKLSKLLIKLGGVAIGGMVANEANKYVSSEIDDVMKTVNDAKELAESIRKEAERTGEVNA